MAIPDANTQDWNWLDQFNRSVLGPDYVGLNTNPSIENGQLILAQNMAPGTQEQGAMPVGVTVASTVWNGRSVQVQFDASRITNSPSSYIAWQAYFGIRIRGTTKDLVIFGGQVRWGNDYLFNPQAGAVPNDTVVRHRITVDTTTGRIQASQSYAQTDAGLADLPIPADYATEVSAGAQVDVILWRTASNLTGGTWQTYRLIVDNLAIRSGDGTASTATGTVGGASVPRLGGVIRFGGAPDNSIGADGDVWVDKTASPTVLYQKINGAYVVQHDLQGDEGPPGPAGSGGSGSGNVPILFAPGLASVTIPMLPADQGGMAGQVLLQVGGPGVTVETGATEATLTPVQLPFVAGATGFMRLTRDPALPLGSQIGVRDLQAPVTPVTGEQHSGFHLIPPGNYMYLPPGPSEMGASVKVFALSNLPAGLAQCYFQTTSSDGGDIDIRIYKFDGTGWVSVASGATGSPSENVILEAPAAGWYATRITLYQDDSGGTSTTGFFAVIGI